MPDLDLSIFERPKAGFVLPIEVWAKDRPGRGHRGAVLGSRPRGERGLQPRTRSAGLFDDVPERRARHLLVPDLGALRADALVPETHGVAL